MCLIDSILLRAGAEPQPSEAAGVEVPQRVSMPWTRGQVLMPTPHGTAVSPAE